MATSSDWIFDSVCEFLKGPIWVAPIQNFIEDNCVTFSYDELDDDIENDAVQEDEKKRHQMAIHRQYAQLVKNLINGLKQDLGIDDQIFSKVCSEDNPNCLMQHVCDAYEQLWAADDFTLFTEMMRRKNLILQLQALVALQLHCGILKQSDTADDIILALLIQATTQPAEGSRRQSVTYEPIIHTPTAKIQHQQEESEYSRQEDDDDVIHTTPAPKKNRTPRENKQKQRGNEIIRAPLPDLRRADPNESKWIKNIKSDQTKDQKKEYESDDENENEDDTKQNQTNQVPTSISSLSEDELRKKFKQLTVGLDPEALSSRSNFLKKQRDLIIEKQKNERKNEFENNNEKVQIERPRSAAQARKALNLSGNEKSSQPQKTNDIPQDKQLTDAEIQRRRDMAAKLKREVVDKH